MKFREFEIGALYTLSKNPIALYVIRDGYLTPFKFKYPETVYLLYIGEHPQKRMINQSGDLFGPFYLFLTKGEKILVKKKPGTWLSNHFKLVGELK